MRVMKVDSYQKCIFHSTRSLLSTHEEISTFAYEQWPVPFLPAFAPVTFGILAYFGNRL